MIEKRIYYHNGTAYIEIDNLSIIDGLPIEETIDDTLDNATLIVKNEIESFLELWSSVKIVSGTLTKCFLVSDIFSKRESDIQVKYQHTISLIEPTKYLEKVYCSSMSFTNKNDTLLMQLQKALINAEIKSEYENPRFSLSTALINRLTNEPARDFFFDKATLREIIDGILEVLDLRVEVYEITDFDNITLDYYDINAKNDLISLGEIVDEQSVENLEYLGSDIEAYGENSFSGSRSAIYHPSPNGWDTFKTNEATLTSDNAVMSTAFPIEEILEFILNQEFSVLFVLGQTSTELILNSVDISRNVVDADIFNVLINGGSSELIKTNTLYKENTMPFQRGQETIDVQQKFSEWLFYSTLNLEAAIYNAVYNSPEVQNWLEENDGAYVNNIQGLGSGVTQKKLEELIFRIKYIPYIDAHTKISKANYSKVPSTLIDNQSDKTIDLERYGDNLSSTVNRLGNKTLTIDKVHNSMGEVFEVQDYTADNYVLTKRTIALYNHVIKAHYEFTKDFNSINERIGIDREKRIYSIPLENVKRDILIKEYMLASFNGASENNGINELFMRVFSPSVEKLPITNAIVRTRFDGFTKAWNQTTRTDYTVSASSGANAPNSSYLPNPEDYQVGTVGLVYDDTIINPVYYEVGFYANEAGYSSWLELPVAPYAMATSLHFRFKLQDNYSAGMSVTNQVVGGKKQVANPYTNKIGEHKEARIILLNDKLATRSELYSYIKLLPKTNISWYANTKKILDKTFKVEKDAYEHMSYVYQLEVLSNDVNIIIGKAIAKLNPMVSDLKYSLKVYTSETELYSESNLKAKGQIDSSLWFSVTNNSLTIIYGDVAPYDPINMPNLKSWCIADNYGNILVAVNKVGTETIKNKVYFNYSTSRN
jgi:uncharacterized protein YdhG (YjbR/CyaY superfamily)